MTLKKTPPAHKASDASRIDPIQRLPQPLGAAPWATFVTKQAIAAGAPFHRPAFSALKFEAEPGQTVMLPTNQGVEIFVGLGDKAELARDEFTPVFQAAGTALARLCLNHDITHVNLNCSELFNTAQDAGAVLLLLMDGMEDARWRHLLDSGDGPVGALPALNVSLAYLPARVEPLLEDDEYRDILTQLAISGHLYRRLATLPANSLGPEKMAEAALAIAAAAGGDPLCSPLSVEIKQASELEREGYNLLHAVGMSAPEAPPQMVILRYSGAPEDENIHLGLVGKGIMFDTGGHNLKTSGGMATMKMDMAGSALALALTRFAAETGMPLNIVTVLPLAYNMISPTALMPGDVVEEDGKKVIITNTDAEGRLAMASALHYLKREVMPLMTMDMATLTGAAAVALGGGHTPFVMKAAQNSESLLSELLNELLESGEAANDLFHPMPLTDYHRNATKGGSMANLQNAAGGGAGMMTAAAFLEAFLPENTSWLHVDIAGTADGAASAAGTAYGPGEASGRAFLPLALFLGCIADGVEMSSHYLKP